MRSYSDASGLKRLAVVSVFASVAAVLGIVEAMIPFAVAIPGAKLGLGNIMVLACLYFFPARDAITLILLKTMLTSFVFGSFSAFLFSLAGAVCSLAVMGPMLRLGRSWFSLPGISIAGGVAHNAGQLAVAALVLGTTNIFFYFPVLIVSGLATGWLVGLAARRLVDALERSDVLRFMRASSPV